jgi:hypothetical protein
MTSKTTAPSVPQAPVAPPPPAQNAAPPPPASRPAAPPTPTSRPSVQRATGRPAQPAAQQAGGLKFGTIASSAGHRIVAYGPGGVGKSTWAASAPGPVAFFDLDESLPRLKAKLDSLGRTPGQRVVNGINSWSKLRAALAAPGWDEIRTIVVDSGTVAEEYAIAHTLATVPKERGERAKNVEDYGYGKGYQHVYDTFIPMLADLDSHAAAGRHVVLICHDHPTTTPNPAGPDYSRFEPRLQTSGSGKASIRYRVREWADHVLYINYDVNVVGGKAEGSGTATINPKELPYFMAKSRTMVAARPLGDRNEDFWAQLLV